MLGEMGVNIMIHDATVIRDARRQLETAARTLTKLLQTADMDNKRVAALLSMAMANIHAAEARLHVDG